VESKIAVVETKLEDVNAEHSAELQFELRISLARTLHGDRAIDPFTFDNSLRHRPRGYVEVLVVVDDPDAHGFGSQLWNAFRASGWHATIQRLPPETAAIWRSMVVRCHPWDMKYDLLRNPPRTAVEVLIKTLGVGIEAGKASPIWEEPDSNLSDGHCVIEVHPQTPFERQQNTNK
jgi:hypothetical protein